MGETNTDLPDNCLVLVHGQAVEIPAVEVPRQPHLLGIGGNSKLTLLVLSLACPEDLFGIFHLLLSVVILSHFGLEWMLFVSNKSWDK